MHQCSWTYDEEGNRCWTADRRAGEVFAAAESACRRGGRDRYSLVPTVGHWFKGQSQRRPDAMKTTTALTEFRVIETPLDLALFGGTGAAAVDPLVWLGSSARDRHLRRSCLPAS
ncbi:hypothetical protein ACIBJI_24675 [Nocardia sp. NPDC050408]|uniref:hypothetical protein n=1 Tax=Nocardia sp. NPDC050408 TaxID=3364319 RepID=UPI0037B199F4